MKLFKKQIVPVLVALVTIVSSIPILSAYAEGSHDDCTVYEWVLVGVSIVPGNASGCGQRFTYRGYCIHGYDTGKTTSATNYLAGHGASETTYGPHIGGKHQIKTVCTRCGYTISSSYYTCSGPPCIGVLEIDNHDLD